MWKEFKNFVMRGNAVDLAIGIIIGVAFSAIVNSLVNDIIMPPIGLALGKVDFVNLFTVLKQGSTPGPYLSLETAKSTGAVTLNYGFFVNTLISFLLIATVLFFIVKAMNTFKKREAASTKICPFCFTTINIKATKCPNCTSGLS
jgi:large conductance mechanosensitive channel